MGVGEVKFPENVRYAGIRFYIISVMRGGVWVGVAFP